MPVSSEKGKSIIKNWFEKQDDIRVVVDLGPGSGTYPKLLRFPRKIYDWKAIEIWAPYIKKFNLKQYYMEIRIGDIQYVELPKGDCAIIGDVLEHLPKAAAIRTLKKIDRNYKHVILSIPTNSSKEKQKFYLEDPKFAGYGNKFEEHLSVWTYQELEDLIPPKYKIRERVDPLAIYIK